MVLNHTHQEICVYLGRTDRRTIHSYGIEFECLFYNSKELSVVYRLMSPYDRGRKALPVDDPAYEDPEGKTDGKVFLKYDPMDIGAIWVLNPLDRVYAHVPALLKEYAVGMSMRRHKLNVAYARQLVATVVDEAALLRAHMEINALIASASIHDAERLGKALGRSLGLSLPSPDKPTPEQDAPPAANSPPGSAPPMPAASGASDSPAINRDTEVVPTPRVPSDDYDDLSIEAEAWSN